MSTTSVFISSVNEPIEPQMSRILSDIADPKRMVATIISGSGIAHKWLSVGRTTNSKRPQLRAPLLAPYDVALFSCATGLRQ